MSESRLSLRLRDLRTNKRKALVSFITAGDPSLDATVPALHQLVSSGVDVLELGVPFSDPEAEGPAIQASSERALKNGVTLRSVLDMVREFRQQDAATPIVLMGYLNSIMAMGEGAFADAAADAGVDGCIVVNLPPEEAEPLQQELHRHGLDLVLLVAPTTTATRRQYIVERSGGFVYYVSLKGITGAAHLAPDEVRRNVSELQVITDLPVLVGFGIRDGATAASVASVADGVVVGSALVNTMGDSSLSAAQRLEALDTQVRDVRAGLDRAGTTHRGPDND